MKKPVLVVLSFTLAITTAYAQQIDKYADYYFYSAFNKQQKAIQAAIAADSAQKGFFLVTHIEIDTLNKQELLPSQKDTRAGAAIHNNGTVIGVMPALSVRDEVAYDLMEGAVAVHKDTFKIMAVARTGFFRHALFCGFTATIGKSAVIQAQYTEESLDSAAIYRTTASPKKLSRIAIPAYVSNAYSTAWPGNVERVYGRAVLTTDPFYVRDENFANKYILQRYTIDFVYRSPVHKIK